MHEITDRFNTYFFYTITAYGVDLEPGVPSIQESINTLKSLSGIVGKQRLTWRYDPVLLTKKYTIDYHRETFEYMASELAPYVDRCVFSFVEMYKKVELNMAEIIPLTRENIEQLAELLGSIAKKHQITLQICGTDEDFTRYGIQTAGCMTLEVLGYANGVAFKNLKHKGMRHGCHCIETRDIGAYETCPNGCKYCYANKDPRKAAENYKLHDPHSPLLLGWVNEDDEIKQSVQKSFLLKQALPGQTTLSL